MDDLKIFHWQLVEKKDSIIQSMNLHNQLVSALWRLPTEFLSHIFVHCLPETSRLPYASKRLAPVLLTRICRRWREVAVGTSNSRRRLMLQSSEDDNKHWESLAFCYDLWLKRSRGLPLSLEAWCDTNDSIEALFSHTSIKSRLSISVLSSRRTIVITTYVSRSQVIDQCLDDHHLHVSLKRTISSVSEECTKLDWIPKLQAIDTRTVHV
ncbi:hypothetical protein DEU56DRAFT_863056 [Suillus clintonianus]|uniref:uncharacterized protein n=1 Tax=Suillus clintonianus TaxID=1904413 RepID=UPI001B86CC25|nr:uncharacterized protein DEU56DRAFT_863056 [Suillus clintonianus]KAG2125021.1 hypothetical protein DEU56DRAFT_863056 [Suillus clintonianus]